MLEEPQLEMHDKINSMPSSIHPTAIVSSKAELGFGVSIGPYSIIGDNVKLDDGVKIHAHCVVNGRTTIGKNTEVFSFSSLGAKPQDLKYRGEDAELIIGSNNQIREYCNFSIGTETGSFVTRIGDNNLFMVYTHVAHDCIIGSHCIIANGVSLGGHVEIDDRAVLGGHCAVHQFVKVGTLAMLAGGAIVVQDVLPYTTVSGNHASSLGLNILGLRRAGFDKEQIARAKMIYKTVFQSSLSIDEASEQIGRNDSEEARIVIAFLKKSTRGICR